MADKNGVVVITMKERGKETTVVKSDQPQNSNTTQLAVKISNSKSGATVHAPISHPLVFVDGIEKESNVLNTIDIKTIASLTILNDSAATKTYGSKGKNGVILITLKKKIKFN